MAPIDKLLMHSSQEVMRCSLQMVFQWTEELSIRTNGANHKASLMNGDFFFTNGTIGDSFLTIGICLCILDMCDIWRKKVRTTNLQNVYSLIHIEGEMYESVSRRVACRLVLLELSPCSVKFSVQ